MQVMSFLVVRCQVLFQQLDFSHRTFLVSRRVSMKVHFERLVGQYRQTNALYQALESMAMALLLGLLL